MRRGVQRTAVDPLEVLKSVSKMRTYGCRAQSLRLPSGEQRRAVCTRQKVRLHGDRTHILGTASVRARAGGDDHLPEFPAQCELEGVLDGSDILLSTLLTGLCARFRRQSVELSHTKFFKTTDVKRCIGYLRPSNLAGFVFRQPLIPVQRRFVHDQHCFFQGRISTCSRVFCSHVQKAKPGDCETHSSLAAKDQKDRNPRVGSPSAARSCSRKGAKLFAIPAVIVLGRRWVLDVCCAAKYSSTDASTRPTAAPRRCLSPISSAAAICGPNVCRPHQTGEKGSRRDESATEVDRAKLTCRMVSTTLAATGRSKSAFFALPALACSLSIPSHISTASRRKDSANYSL